MIELPPLREHKEDLEELIRYRLDATAFQYVHSFSGISPEVMEIFRSYSWPGNVRELFHVLDYAQNAVSYTHLAEQNYPAPGEGKGRHAGQQDRLYRRNGRKADGTEKNNESGYQHDQQRDFFFSGIWGSKKNFC